MITWLTGSALGLSRWIWLLALAALIGGAVWMLSAAEKADDKANQQIGRTEEQLGQARTTIEQVGKANEAEAQISASPDARRAGCLRHSRTPENCR